MNLLLITLQTIILVMYNNDYKLALIEGRGEGRTLFNEDVIELEETDDDLTAIVVSDRSTDPLQTIKNW